MSEEPWSLLSIFFSTCGSTVNNKLLFKFPHFCKKKLSSNKEERFDDEEIRDEIEQLNKLSDSTLAHISIPNTYNETETIQDVKINGLRFVGFTVNLDYKKLTEYKNKRFSSDNESDGRSSCSRNQLAVCYNIVFVLKTVADRAMVRSYSHLAAKIGRSLRIEEIRSSYVSQQIDLMLSIHDNDSFDCGDIHKLILSKCTFAQSLQHIFTSLRNTGIVEIYINDNMRVSFCLYHKVHTSVNTSFNKEAMTISQALQVMKNIQPYHGLLVYDTIQVKNSLNASCSTSIILFLQACSPLKSLQQISVDTNIPINHINDISCHLVAWGKACIIYPLCEANIYMLAPTAELKPSSVRSEQFKQLFNLNLIKILQFFSIPTSVGNLSKFQDLNIESQNDLIKIIVWLLRHRFLYQLHTYILFLPLKTNDNLKNLNSDFLSVSLNQTFDDLSALPISCQLVLQPVVSSVNLEDIKLFCKLFKYFNGNYHLEDIMYQQNISRRTLSIFLEKFQPILLTIQRSDETTCPNT